ncbi:MAG: GntR family transcriptional regulator [Opitutaceae bacterium]|nr:GntR family transcriptional regulator [Opitutaceae bacterium]
MSSSRSPFDLPHRLSLSAQTAAAIRKAIEQGLWEGHVPSERRLCDVFKVSRPTVRTALHALAKEGWLEIRQGCRNRILPRRKQAATPRNRVIGVISAEPVSQLAHASFNGVTALRTTLADHGFATEMLVCQANRPSTQRRKIEAFVREHRVHGCVLMSVSKEVQQWFMEHGVPALVLGSCHPSVRLPSIDVDNQSVCRHAVGVLLGKGHRSVALVLPDTQMAGDLASETGFLEGVQRHPQKEEITAVVIRHDGTALHLSSRLDVYFRSATPPTGLLVVKPWHVFSVILYLLKRGLTMPDTVSLIARDQDQLFSTVLPSIAHYPFDDHTMARRLSRLVLKLVNEGGLPAEPHLIFPRHFPGESVKPPRGHA